MNHVPSAQRVLAVIAHPDDESFGLGAVIDHYVSDGARVQVLCLTKGEASTLGANPELSAQRELELSTACQALGVAAFELCDYPDGGLAAEDPAILAARVRMSVAEFHPDLLLTFDPLEGVTGHPDHRAATEAAVTVAREDGVQILGWALPEGVADAVNEEFGTDLVGYPKGDLHHSLPVTRDVQMMAVRAHTSQAVPGSLLWRRLELLGDREYLRRL
ncbi:PIG-L deacetylase family protein [Tessaracoccus sp. ZS01]|uniref:PIG-L deacetylase family protein n=1 Tax=Tessaracoccus sp. ZS01 TaxID=1906324 RepID=UPI00096FD001|nr:PIG-L deacetylase family protein [Tessaracoccus sp. ZS01]MCG6566468.1 PIG-L family deacetylase [Tessaracoccus sp. ZS01]OMG58915.1 hypothetical protein BJN44_02340 [Tessaracoccus sp. ZS01]